MDNWGNIERWRVLDISEMNPGSRGLNQEQKGMDPMCTEVDGMSGHSNKQGMCMFKTVQAQDRSQFTLLTVQIKRTVSTLLVLGPLPWSLNDRGKAQW